MTATLKLSRTNRAKLETTLRDLIEADRQAFVALFSLRIHRRVQHFLEKRGPNQLAYEFYQGNVPEGIVEATDQDEAVVKAIREASPGPGFARFTQKTRPAFVVARRPDADQRIKVLAERSAEDLIQVFLSRAIEKLGPVVERKGAYTITKVTNPHGQFSVANGHWEGRLTFTFDDGTHFSASLQIITNYRNGRPYGQYPFRFYDCTLVPGAESGAASIEEIWASVGYVLPAPVKRRRWEKIVSGSVLLIDGKHHIVNGKLGIKKKDIPAGAEQVARIEAGEVRARVEDVNPDVATRVYQYTEEERARFDALRREYKSDDLLRRQVAFEAFFPVG